MSSKGKKRDDLKGAASDYNRAMRDGDPKRAADIARDMGTATDSELIEAFGATGDVGFEYE